MRELITDFQPKPETSQRPTAVAGTALAYDLKGNLTTNQNGAQYTWDSENRLVSATVNDAASGATDTAAYRYDALGRRIQKQVYGIVTTFIHDGAQVIHEFDAPIAVASSAQASDGTGSGTATGGVLTGTGVTRINFQPATSPIPPGYYADKGRTYAVRTNGKSYGWDITAPLTPMARNQLFSLPQWDTFIQFGTVAPATFATWKIGGLTAGTYAVVVVMGDCASGNQTDDLTISGNGATFTETDPDPAVLTPPNYQRGDFDGYAETVTVGADGLITIAARSTSFNPKLCFVEIGPVGSSISQADRDRLASVIDDANAATAKPPFPKPQPNPRLYAYGSYVDEPLMLKAGAAKYYYASNHLYSVAALTDATGAVVERYKYDAYGKQGILASNGTVSYSPSDYGQFVGFTGRYHDWETGLVYQRTRMFDTGLGRFINRDLAGYVNGSSLYSGYYVPNGVDPTGLLDEAGHFYTTYLVAMAAGLGPDTAWQLAYWSQYPDEDARFDAVRAPKGAADIKRYLHSLTGGDATKLRQYLACLLKSGQFKTDEEGILIHALGDAYAHSYPGGHGWRDPNGIIYRENYDPKRMRNGWQRVPLGELLFDSDIGHITSGHLPDYIASDPGKFGSYADNLFGILSSMNGGAATHPEWIDALKIQANNFSKPGLWDFFSDSSPNGQNHMESNAIRHLAGGIGDDPYYPENQDSVPADKPIMDDATMKKLINKIKEGVKGCCPQ